MTKFWITDGRSKAYDLKQEIKNHGGKWDPDKKRWYLINPDQSTIRVLKMSGLRLNTTF